MTSSAQPRPDSSGAGPRPIEGRVLVLGEVLYDHLPDGSIVLGGAPFNVAWHLCGFGRDPVLVSAVGDDEEGRHFLDRMNGWGLSTSGITVTDKRSTGRVVVSIEDGEPRYDIPPNQAWDHIPDPALGSGSPGLLYHGTLALRSPAALERVLGLRERYPDTPVFIDLNLREPWWTRELVEACVRGVRWAKVSRDELRELTERAVDSAEECAAAAEHFAQEFGAEAVLVTLGESGSLVLDASGEKVFASATSTADVVDTVGAGDAFSAVFCLGALAGWEVQTTLERAGRFAADLCQVRGATNADLSLYDKHLRRWAVRPPTPGPDKLRVLMLSVHGLLRGSNIELGRDADTGGQILYVIDQARALAEHPAVGEVTVVTRLVEDKRVDASYAHAEEPLAPGARIVRLRFGPRRYLRKESLWPYLDELLDELTRWVRTQPHPPDVIHGHYADAGYVGAQLSKLLGVPFVFTGHSLGRIKLERLLADGMKKETIEQRYRISRRIEAEEQALEAADLVIASTSHEIREQFEGYEYYVPERMHIIPPGVDLGRFSPPRPDWEWPPFVRELSRFLLDPEKPLILAIARPDERKNFPALIRAFARTPGLRYLANLAIIAGNRDDIRKMSPAPRRVLIEILRLIDVYDLYGHVAYPKTHASPDVPDLYRYAAHTKGLHVNAALTEPFGLTLLEAAATGLPVVATLDGGPRDILEACDHGLLADPLDPDSIGAAMMEVLSSDKRWGRWSKNAISRVHERFAWASHAQDYVSSVEGTLAGTSRPGGIGEPTHLRTIDRLVVTDIDETLAGDEEGLAKLMERIRAEDQVGFGIATGRSLGPTLALLDELGVEIPDVIVTSSGAEVRYGQRLVRDRSWERQIRHRWEPELVREALDPVEGLAYVDAESTEYRLRFRMDRTAPSPQRIRRILRNSGARATVITDRGKDLDVLPVRASPGLAIRFVGFKWNLEPGRILVAGDSGNDRDMLEGDTLGVVVGNHTEELEPLRDCQRIYFAEGRYAWGVLEGLEHYDFFGSIRTEDDHTDAR